MNILKFNQDNDPNYKDHIRRSRIKDLFDILLKDGCMTDDEVPKPSIDYDNFDQEDDEELMTRGIVPISGYTSRELLDIEDEQNEHDELWSTYYSGL